MSCCEGKGQQLGSQLSDRPCHTPLGQDSCSQLHPQPCVLIQGGEHTHTHAAGWHAEDKCNLSLSSADFVPFPPVSQVCLHTKQTSVCAWVCMWVCVKRATTARWGNRRHACHAMCVLVCVQQHCGSAESHLSPYEWQNYCITFLKKQEKHKDGEQRSICQQAAVSSSLCFNVTPPTLDLTVVPPLI